MSNTVFKEVGYQLSTLVSDIEMGQVGLPDIQRPFVWEPSKVRDLFDSMYRGYPVGHLLLWDSGAEPGARQIGTGDKPLAPKYLIVDGQQRLTSLYAVLRGQEVIGRDFSPRRIRIAFRPRDAHFAVADAATANDPAYLNDIGEIWARSSFAVITEFLARLRDAGGLEDGSEDALAAALSRLEALKSYPFTALVLGADLPEEEVAEVFVRINSKGKNLNQADFILTLMSVFWDEGRSALERWSRDCRRQDDAAWNPYLNPDPEHLLRVAIALGFRRGRLQDAYVVLRGRDPRTKAVSLELREAQFSRLAQAQERVLDKEVWKEFLQCLHRAGHRSSGTISSTTAVLYAYAFYLIGKHDYAVPTKLLRDVIARWFFMTTLTARYSSSAETRAEADLASLPQATDADAFVEALDEIIANTLTGDYWRIALPGALATSAGRSPALSSYIGALCIHDAPVLFSDMSCAALLDPALVGKGAKLQRHHLFPKQHLKNLGIVDNRQINQIANLTPLEWHDNLAISAADPSAYWPVYLAAMRKPPPGMPAFTAGQIERMLHLHALPDDWPNMEYHEFLVERRRRMARVIREAFDRLKDGVPTATAEPAWPPTAALVAHLLEGGETQRVEFKSSLRADIAGKGVPAKVLEKVVARTIAGFLNHGGGTLIIGANDDGQPLGLDRDLATLKRPDLDGFEQALVQVLANYLGANVAASVRIAIVPLPSAGTAVAVVECGPHSAPVYLKDGQGPEFHVRAGNTTRQLNIQECTAYIATHWTASATRGGA